MEWKEIPIATWRDFEDAFENIFAGGSNFLFRGQDNQQWGLQPSLLRGVPANAKAADVLAEEKQSIEIFRREAHHYLRTSDLPPDVESLERFNIYVKWLMLMQHYGAPTRLLDWSYSPYIAMYFATINRWDKNAAIWYFDAALLTEHYKSADIDFTKMDVDSLCSVEATGILYTAMAKLETMREISQQAVFTLCSNVLDNHDVHIINACCGTNEQASSCGKIIIPAELKPEFCWRLRLMNLTSKALFPGIEGICRSLGDDMRLRWESTKRSAE